MSDQTGPWLLIASSVVGAVGIMFVVGMIQKRKAAERSEALTSVAARLRFAFRPDGSDDLRSRLASMPFFSQGYDRRLLNLFERADPFPGMSCFDYLFTVGGGKSRHQVRQTVALIELATAAPAFTLKPESLADKIAVKFGGTDLNFDAHPAFSSTYRLRGTDEAAVRRLFTDVVLSRFEQVERCSVECDGSNVIFYRFGKRVSPDDYETFAREARDVLNALFPTTRPPVAFR